MHDSIETVLERIEAKKRRKKEILYKKIVMAIVVILVISPTILCIILFIQVHKLNDRINNIRIGNNEDKTVNNVNSINKKDNVEVTEEDKNKRVVYLTFDDGPSKNTAEILNILKRYNVKATFFVVGKTDPESINLYKRIVAEGHSIGMHSYTHVYKDVYSSVQNFEYDLKKIQNCIYDATGVTSKIYRFPGGSSNSKSSIDMKIFIKYLNENSYVYFDWNVSSGDASGQKQSKDTIYNNIMQGIANKKVSVVLMHDVANKDTTVEALSKVIEKIKSEGILLKPLDENVEPIQHVTIQ